MRKLISLVVAIGAVGCGDNHASIKYTAPSPSVTSPVQEKLDVKEKKTYQGDEFKNLVMGKTEDEVETAIGKPGKIVKNVVGNPDKAHIALHWEYYEIVHDPDSKKPLPVTVVQFGSQINADHKARVDLVTFQ